KKIPKNPRRGSSLSLLRSDDLPLRKERGRVRRNLAARATSLCRLRETRGHQRGQPCLRGVDRQPQSAGVQGQAGQILLRDADPGLPAHLRRVRERAGGRALFFQTLSGERVSKGLRLRRGPGRDPLPSEKKTLSLFPRLQLFPDDVVGRLAD